MREKSDSEKGEGLVRMCDSPSCSAHGLYPAPKNRNGKGGFWHFCLLHVREYNANWDYLSGFSPEAIEKHIRESTVWERPTWPLGKGPFSTRKETQTTKPLPKKILQALAVLRLSPPASFAAIKAQYRALAKKYHPDALGGSRAEIEKFHALQQAFATLAVHYATQTQQKKTSGK